MRADLLNQRRRAEGCSLYQLKPATGPHIGRIRPAANRWLQLIAHCGGALIDRCTSIRACWLTLRIPSCGRDWRECPPTFVRSRTDPRQDLMHDAKLVILCYFHSSASFCANFQPVVFVLCLHLHERSRKTFHRRLQCLKRITSHIGSNSF